MTGMTLDAQGDVRYLDGAEWSERLETLVSKGIPLSQGTRWSLDPILHGLQPTAREGLD